MKQLIFLLFLMAPASAPAIDQCVTIATNGWTQNRINRRIATGLALLVDSGHTIAPTINGEDICADIPETLSTIITPTTMLTKYNELEAELAAANVAQQVLIDALEAETQANEVCAAPLADIDALIDNQIDQITDLATAKTVLRASLKKIARCLRVIQGISN